MKIAVTGILHSKSKRYYNEYIRTIYNQSYTEKYDLMLFTHKVNDNRGIYIDRLLSVPESKKYSIDYLKSHNYDYVIFTDTDDFFHRDYIKLMMKHLKKYDIVFCDVALYHNPNKITYDYFKKCNVPEIVDISYLKENHCIGFGNSAINMKLYDVDIGRYPENFNICDWWFFRKIMKRNKCKAYFIKKSLVYYRQHADNINYPNAGEMKLWKQE